MFDKFLTIVNNPLAFRIFLIRKLPAAFFSGVKMQYTDEERCIVTIKYKWFTKNPFRSTYFACLGMAAEMSTGVLAMGHAYKKEPPVSMLVTKVEGRFLKKATGRTQFICEDGLQIKSAIREAIATGKGSSVTAWTFGKNSAGEAVAEFQVTWSFKSKQ